MNYWLRGSGPPILFLHGIPASGRLWDYVVERLQRQYTCVVVDLPGMGTSPPLRDGSRDPERFAQELEALRHKLHLPAWYLVGHDAGATVAVHYAVTFPERLKRLALLSPPVFPEFRPPWFFRLLRVPLVGDLLAPLVRLLIWKGGLQSIIERRDASLNEILEAFRHPFRGWAGARRLAWLVRWGKPAEVLGKTAALLPQISVPTLILQGRRDGAVPESFAQRACESIPDARVQFFDTGHFLPLNIPEVLCDQLGCFFAPEVRPVVARGNTSAGRL